MSKGQRWKARVSVTLAAMACGPRRGLADTFVLFVEEGYVKMFLRGRPVTMYMPKEQVGAYSLEAKAELPARRLKLEWVYPLCIGQVPPTLAVISRALRLAQV